MTPAQEEDEGVVAEAGEETARVGDVVVGLK